MEIQMRYVKHDINIVKWFVLHHVFLINEGLQDEQLTWFSIYTWSLELFLASVFEQLCYV